MKNISFIICLTLAALLTACNDSRVSDMQMSGDCNIEALRLDTYDGVIDAKNQTVLVRVPETYNEKAMTLTSITLSKGATVNMAQGDKLNMTAPRTLHVQNGSVYADWTLTVKHDEARILSFRINNKYNGVIDEEAKTIAVSVPKDLDIKSLVPTITLSDGATVNPAAGVACDFTNPVKFTVTNNTASAVYTVTVTAIGKPAALYIGLAQSPELLPIEEQTACEWMTANIPNSMYASFDDIAAGNVDISECKIMWWHFHKDGGVDGKEKFEAAAPEALRAQAALRKYYNRGGAFLFTRYATNMPAFLGAVKNEGCPNNCWGQFENDAETVGGPWSFKIEGRNSHPLYADMLFDGDNNWLPCFDTGYRTTNSTAQWHIGADWGGYATHEEWRNATGGLDLAWGGDGAIVAWEFPAADGNGGILCIGSGCYDWYSVDPRPDDRFHGNIATMTLNAFNYLMK